MQAEKPRRDAEGERGGGGVVLIEEARVAATRMSRSKPLSVQCRAGKLRTLPGQFSLYWSLVRPLCSSDPQSKDYRCLGCFGANGSGMFWGFRVVVILECTAGS